MLLLEVLGHILSALAGLAGVSTLERLIMTNWTGMCLQALKGRRKLCLLVSVVLASCIPLMLLLRVGRAPARALQPLSAPASESADVSGMMQMFNHSGL